jgi:hypothetical protein
VNPLIKQVNCAWFLVLIFMTVLSGCGGSSGGGTPTVVVPVATPAANIVTVNSSISAPTTWQTGKVYVVGSITVSSSLTIQPGVTVKFTSGGGLDVSSAGVINAAGTAAQPVVFTSIKDDYHGGITNSNVLTPAVGAWNQITLNSSGSSFDHCEFYYSGGNSAYKSAIRVGGAYSATITNSVFAHNDGGGISDSSAPKGVVNAEFATASTVITGNVFYDNNVPLLISGLFSVDDSNTFHNPTNAATINKYNGIYLIGHSAKPITGTISFLETEVPFVLAGYVTVPTGSALTIGDGVVFKFFSASDDLQVSGTLNANASAGKKIVFTSMKDDAHGGDTNGDGTASTPAANDWPRITLNASGSTFNRCEFYYGGNSVYKSVLRFGGAYSASITNSIFAHNDGGDVSNSSTPNGALDADTATSSTVITGNTFYDNNVPLKISGLFSIDDSNTFHNPASPTTINKYNGIFLIGHSAKDITGLITFAETEVPYVLAGYVTVPASSALTLKDDVVIKFFSGADKLTVYGTLKADATAGHKIVFTSMKDDAHGGDTNGDGSATTPLAKDWDQIILEASGSSFTRSEFYYGGHTSATSVLKFGGGSTTQYIATITNSIFAHNDGGDVSDISWYAFGALNANNASYGTVITNNVFYDNNVPLKISGKFSLDDSNIFHDPNNPTVKNKYNGICMSGNSYNDFLGQITLLETEVPFVIQGDIAVPSGSTLTLGAGVIFKFHASPVNQLRILGSVVEGAGVIYTSLKDDSYLGDTNGDGAASSPASGDWYGIKNSAGAWIHPSNMFYNKY